MAGFKVHITTSTIVGVGVGAIGYAVGIPLDSCMLGAGMCSVAGMLPDLDSDTGIPLREATCFLSAVIPLLMIHRFQHLGLTPEAMVLAGCLIYVVVRFGLAEFLKKYTVHRGMFHSLPAAVCFMLVGYLLCECENQNARFFKAIAIGIGYMVHLLLDEFYSIEWKRGRMRLKKSFGTAVKLWGKSMWGNISTYGKLIVLGLLAFGDPIIMERLEENIHHIKHQSEDVHHVATDLIDTVRR